MGVWRICSVVRGVFPTLSIIMRLIASALLLGLGLAQATNITYVTDLPIATSLASCAYEVISVHFLVRSNSPCPTEATQFQSCICASLYSNISWTISDAIIDFCGGYTTGNRDQSSVITVLDAYCNQDTTYNFETADRPVTRFIDDLDAYTALESCAKDPLLSVISSVRTEYRCPSYASGLAPCLCKKSYLSTVVDNLLEDSVEEACGSSQSVKAAKNVFASYCQLTSAIATSTTSTRPAEKSAEEMSHSGPHTHETASSSASSNDGENTNGLASGAVAGIAVGCVAFLALLTVAIFCLFRRRNTKATKPNDSIPLNDQSRIHGNGNLAPDENVAPPAYEAGDFGKRFQREQDVSQ